MALLTLITSPDAALRDLSLDAACEKLSLTELLAEADAKRRKPSDSNMGRAIRAVLVRRK